MNNILTKRLIFQNFIRVLKFSYLVEDQRIPPKAYLIMIKNIYTITKYFFINKEIFY